MSRHLFIVAHPDDEILGACGTIVRLAEQGESVAVAVLSQRSKTRENSLLEKAETTHRELGVNHSYFFDYEMMKFDKYDRYKMTTDIESVIVREQPDVIYTHDPNDIHNDHRTLYGVVMEAAKLPMRHNSTHPISAIYTMEIPSSTDWGAGFIPNSFVEVTREQIQKKAQILTTYDDVIRESPHPRNYDSFVALARYRGSQCGLVYAEAFRKVFERTGR